MTSLGGFVAKYFPLFLLGAIFGRLMSDSGSASSIAAFDRREARPLAGAARAGAGVRHPHLRRGVGVRRGVRGLSGGRAAVPRRQHTRSASFPAAILLGGATFTLSGIPGTPSIQNAMPMSVLRHRRLRRAGIGSIAGLVMLALGTLWLNRRASQAAAAGEGYGVHAARCARRDAPAPHEPPLMVALVPLVMVLLVNLAMTWWIIPAMDLAYLKEPKFGGVARQRRARHLGARRVAVAGHPHRHRAALVAVERPPIVAQPGHLQLDAADLQHRVRDRLRRRDRLAGGVCRRAGGAGRRLGQRARVGGDHGEHHGRHHRLRGRRAGAGARHDGEGLRAGRRGGRHQPGTAAPRGGDCRGRARLAAAQRRRGQHARHLPPDAPRVVPRHLHGVGGDSAGCAGGRAGAGLDVRGRSEWSQSSKFKVQSHALRG